MDNISVSGADSLEADIRDDSITQKIIKEFADGVVDEKNKQSINQYNDKLTQKQIEADKKTMFEGLNRSFLSASITSDTTVNNFLSKVGLLINVNKNKVLVKAANSADSMTSNKDHFVVDEVIMPTNDYKIKYEEWQKAKKDIIIKNIESFGLTENEKIKDIEETEQLFKLLNNATDLQNSLLKELHQTTEGDSVFSKAVLDGFIDKIPDKTIIEKHGNQIIRCNFAILEEYILKSDNNLVKKKWNLLKLTNSTIDIKNRIGDIIKKYPDLSGLIDKASNQKYKFLKETALQNTQKYQQTGEVTYPMLREDGAAIAKIKDKNSIYEDELESGYFGSNAAEKQEYRSYAAAERFIGLRYFEKQSNESMREYVVSKNIPTQENIDDLAELIIDKTTEGKRNEILITLKDIEPYNKDIKIEDYFIGNNAPIESINFYVPDLKKYKGDNDDAKAIDAIFSTDGIKQILPLMMVFGKNPFLDGVKVYDAKNGKKVNVGNFEDIFKKMQQQIITMPPIDKNTKSNLHWLTNEQNKIYDQLNVTIEFQELKNNQKKLKAQGQEIRAQIQDKTNKSLMDYADVKNVKRDMRLSASYSAEFPMPLSAANIIDLASNFNDLVYAFFKDADKIIKPQYKSINKTSDSQTISFKDDGSVSFEQETTVPLVIKKPKEEPKGLKPLDLGPYQSLYVPTFSKNGSTSATRISIPKELNEEKMTNRRHKTSVGQRTGNDGWEEEVSVIMRNAKKL